MSETENQRKIPKDAPFFASIGGKRIILLGNVLVREEDRFDLKENISPKQGKLLAKLLSNRGKTVKKVDLYRAYAEINPEISLLTADVNDALTIAIGRL